MERRLDDVDRRIIYHLAIEARNTSAPTIAEEMDVSPATIRNRIRQLEDRGVIRGYHAHVDYEKANSFIRNLFICTAPVPEREALVARALQVPGVVNVRELMAGQSNVHVLAIGNGTDDITRIARDLSGLGLEIIEEALLEKEEFRPYDAFGPDEPQIGPSLTDFVSLAGGAEIVELTVDEAAPIAGHTLREANERGLISDEVLIIGLERGETMLTPRGDTEIQPGDLLTVFAPEQLDKDILAVFSEDRSVGVQ